MRHDLDAYLDGARDLAELARAARVFDAGDLAEARGLDALVWRALRDLAPLDAARVLLAALGRLDGELGASFRDGAEVLAGLPAEWTHEDARAALHADRFDGALDVPDDADGPALVLCHVIEGAYAVRVEAGAAVAEMAHRVVRELAELLEARALVAFAIGVPSEQAPADPKFSPASAGLAPEEVTA